jgi:hypothetical protein
MKTDGSLKPRPKILAGALIGGPAAIVILWLIPGEEPAAVAGAITTLCSAVAGYFWPDPERDH